MTSQDGIYAVEFSGLSGSGTGVLLLQNGLVTGADTGGVLYDGNAFRMADGGIRFSLTLTVPKGATLVTGLPPQPTPFAFKVDVSLPRDFERRVVEAPAATPYGSVLFRLRRLRALRQ